MLKSVSIIGVGLIGGSIAHAIKKHSPDVQIFGFDSVKISSPIFSDFFVNFNFEILYKSDIVILATPLSSYSTILPQLAQCKTIIDVGSCKAFVKKFHLPNLVPSHPIAGSHQSGFTASSAKLFQGKKVIVTPFNFTDEKIIALAKDFWSLCGATNIVELDPNLHDEIYAKISHFPQALMFKYADLLNKNNIQIPDTEFFRLCHSNANLWQDIFTINKANIIKAEEMFLHELKKIPITDEGFSLHESLIVRLPKVISNTLLNAFSEQLPFAGTGFASLIQFGKIQDITITQKEIMLLS